MGDCSDIKYEFEYEDKIHDIMKWRSTTSFVIEDLAKREAFGLKKYGKALTTNTNEDMLQHLYEELLDASVYIKTLINQRKNK